MNAYVEHFFTPETAADVVGETFTSDWIAIDQERINAFGAVTDDPDPHHIDPEFCAQHSPWGKPISFGFLTISLLTPMLYQVYRYPMDADPVEHGYPASYGFKSIRLVSSVPVDSSIRGHFTVADVRERKPGQKLIIMHFSVEVRGSDKPAVTGEWESLWIKAAA